LEDRTYGKKFRLTEIGKTERKRGCEEGLGEQNAKKSAIRSFTSGHRNVSEVGWGHAGTSNREGRRGGEGRGWGGSDSRGPHNKQNQLIYVLGVPRLVEGDYYRVP